MFVEQNVILSYVSSQRALEDGLLNENFIKSSMQQTSAALKVCLFLCFNRKKYISIEAVFLLTQFYTQ